RGAAVGSRELVFHPGPIRPGNYEIDIGTAGSTTLVLQTLLPALLTAEGASSLTLGGGTHNIHAPPFEFLATAFVPLLNRMGHDIRLQLNRPGFYPAGGGELEAVIQPGKQLQSLELLHRGEVRRRRARAILAHLPRHIAERELAVIARQLQWEEECLEIELWSTSRGPGNIVLVEIETEQLTEVFTGFGQRGVPAEAVAEGVAREVLEYLDCGAPVGPHL